MCFYGCVVCPTDYTCACVVHKTSPSAHAVPITWSRSALISLFIAKKTTFYGCIVCRTYYTSVKHTLLKCILLSLLPANFPWGVFIYLSTHCQSRPKHHSLAGLAQRAHCYSIISLVPEPIMSPAGFRQRSLSLMIQAGLWIQIQISRTFSFSIYRRNITNILIF